MASKLQQIKEILFSSEVKLAEMKLEDGVTVLEAEAFEAGQPVNVKTEDGQLIPLPIGEYKLEDGQVLTVQEEGVIASIGAVEEAEEEPAAEESAMNDEVNESPVPKAIVESVVKETKFSNDMTELEQLKAELTELKAQIAELSKVEEVEEKTEEVTEEVELAKPITHNPDKEPAKTGFTFASKRPETTQDRVWNALSKFK